jgi:cell wall-associated NlpC family hydrolase
MKREHATHLSLVILSALVVVGVIAPPAGAQSPTATDPTSTTTTTSTTLPGDPGTTTTTTAPPVTAAPPTSAAPSTTTTAPLPTTQAPTTAPTTTAPRTPPGPWSVAPAFTVPTDDSLASTEALLAEVIAQQAALDGRRATLQMEVQGLDTMLRTSHARIDDLVARRRAQAVSAFIGGGSIIDSKLRFDMPKVRMMALIEGVERDAADQLRRIRASVSQVEESARSLRSRLNATDDQANQLAAARRTLQDKIAGTIDLSNPVPVGPTDIAAAAAAAQNHRAAVRSLLTAHDGPAASTAAAQYTSDLQTLARLVAGPTPGAYPVPGLTMARPTTTTTTTTPDRTTTTVTGAALAGPAATAAQLVTAWSALDDRRLTVMLFALQQVGKQYIWAAAGPNAYDCSGLTMRSWILGGVRLDHFSGSQARQGPPVTPDQLAPTDLLTYGASGIEHVTMYLGAGRMVEAKGTAYGIIVSDARFSNLAIAVHIL